MPKSFADLFKRTQYPDKNNAVYTKGEIKSCPQWKNVLDCLNNYYKEHRLHRTCVFSALVCEESLTPSLHSLDLEKKLNPDNFSLMQMLEPIKQKTKKSAQTRKADQNTDMVRPMMMAEEGSVNFWNSPSSGFKTTESYITTNHDLSNDKGMLQMLDILNHEHALKDTKIHENHALQTQLFDLKSKSLSDLSDPSVPLPLWFQDTLLQLALQGAQNYCLVVTPERQTKTEISKNVTFDDLVFISAFPHVFNDNTARVQDSLDSLSVVDLNSNFANTTINAMGFYSCNASNRFFNALCAMAYLKSKPDLRLGSMAVLGASSEQWVERMSKMNLLDACDLKGMALISKEIAQHQDNNSKHFNQLSLLSQKLEALFDKKYLSEHLNSAPNPQHLHYKI